MLGFQLGQERKTLWGNEPGVGGAPVAVLAMIPRPGPERTVVEEPGRKTSRHPGTRVPPHIPGSRHDPARRLDHGGGLVRMRAVLRVCAGLGSGSCPLPDDWFPTTSPAPC
ncbi:predicted protein [Streptomyces sp. AA4]|nr:predicted protein [Streptomyces sp. AA4]